MGLLDPKPFPITLTLPNGQEIIDWQAVEYLHWRNQIEAWERRQREAEEAEQCPSP